MTNSALSPATDRPRSASLRRRLAVGAAGAIALMGAFSVAGAPSADACQPTIFGGCSSGFTPNVQVQQQVIQQQQAGLVQHQNVYAQMTTARTTTISPYTTTPRWQLSNYVAQTTTQTSYNMLTQFYATTNTITQYQGW